MPDCQLTPAADDDLLEIARYTIRTWSEEQAERYEAKLRRCFESIAVNNVWPRILLKKRPELVVVRCEHHYVFYRIRKGKVPLIIAILHENMALMRKLSGRLG